MDPDVEELAAKIVSTVGETGLGWPENTLVLRVLFFSFGLGILYDSDAINILPDKFQPLFASSVDVSKPPE